MFKIMSVGILKIIVLRITSKNLKVFLIIFPHYNTICATKIILLIESFLINYYWIPTPKNYLSFLLIYYDTVGITLIAYYYKIY